jgi:hypothetical protein
LKINVEKTSRITSKTTRSTKVTKTREVTKAREIIKTARALKVEAKEIKMIELIEISSKELR